MQETELWKISSKPDTTGKLLIELTALVVLRSFTNYVFANTQVPVDFPLAQAV
ncbi:hypothetical protein P2W68_07745 [Chryseobacterium arthrosphaerae]|uniref:hypothetical protein n=1 Tax=Chryseobacterium arthrosphaerae TaxID=651561 RepID=UPI0023E0DBEE|nr:hypothetical protein [Chryseobacterium arthrosphaerae]WES99502.1 hypothetical protein P2W68_07745 [Chryseobacterium arthrosphaerae]